MKKHTPTNYQRPQVHETPFSHSPKFMPILRQMTRPKRDHPASAYSEVNILFPARKHQPNQQDIEDPQFSKSLKPCSSIHDPPDPANIPSQVENTNNVTDTTFKPLKNQTTHLHNPSLSTKSQDEKCQTQPGPCRDTERRN